MIFAAGVVVGVDRELRGEHVQHGVFLTILLRLLVPMPLRGPSTPHRSGQPNTQSRE